MYLVEATAYWFYSIYYRPGIFQDQKLLCTAWHLPEGIVFDVVVVNPATFRKLTLKDALLTIGEIDAVFVGLTHRFIITQAYINSKSVRTFSAAVGGAQPECACLHAPPRHSSAA